MLNWIVPLVGCYLQSDLVEFWFWPLLCLGILYITPALIRSCFTWR